MCRIFPAVPLRVETACKTIEIEGDAVRLMGKRGRFDQAGIECKPPHERELPGIFEPLERRASQKRGARGWLGRQVREDFTRGAEPGLPPGMPVLDIGDGGV